MGNWNGVVREGEYRTRTQRFNERDSWVISFVGQGAIGVCMFFSFCKLSGKWSKRVYIYWRQACGCMHDGVGCVRCVRDEDIRIYANVYGERGIRLIL